DLGIDSHRLDIKFLARPSDSDRYFSSIGDEHSPNHQTLQDGFRFSRNALSPSCPSVETLRAAIACAVTGIASSRERDHTSTMRAFAAATAWGAAARTSRTYPVTALSRSEAGTVVWMSPISRARVAEKRAPVRKSSLAADRPIFARTKGE